MDRFSIMIVDDDEADRYILKRLLSSSGLESPVIEKCDGLEAIEYFEKCKGCVDDTEQLFPPTIVFLDINMPRMNGFQFLKAFDEMTHSVDGLSSVVFIMVSSSEHITDRLTADSYRFVKGYIAKMPVSGEELRSYIDAKISQGQSS